MEQLAIIILAAGSSSRLGRPKQLLLYNRVTLLEHTIKQAEFVEVNDVIVVLGAHSDKIKRQCLNPAYSIVENPEWEKGMSSSIVLGLQHAISRNQKLKGALFMVCDQPYISSDILLQMVDVFKATKTKIVACRYQNQLGSPALFDSSLFDELLRLNGQFGAKKLIKKHINNVEIVDFPDGHVDIDTPSDYDMLLKKG